MNSNRPGWIKRIAVPVAICALAACATPPPPPPPPAPPPPPPPPAEVIPYRPLPPGGAAYSMDTPPLGAGGSHVTLNSNLDEDATLWHFRSAWNVAALNCLDPSQAPILDGYGKFLKDHARVLTRTNAAIEQAFREQHGSRSNAIKAREAYMTQVYNYFALPPARGNFCNVALQVANEYLLTPPEDPKPFATTNLARIEQVFQDFFREYERYRVDSAAWDAKYGARYGASQPGYVALHGTYGQSVASSLTDTTTTQAVGGVVDPQTGAQIPVIVVPETTVSTPVVQPVPGGEEADAN